MASGAATGHLYGFDCASLLEHQHEGALAVRPQAASEDDVANDQRGAQGETSAECEDDVAADPAVSLNLSPVRGHGTIRSSAPAHRAAQHAA